jgi:hypothetical protein
MNEYAYPWDDEIMAECRARKAQVIEDYGGVEGYYKHLAEDDTRSRLEAEGWKFVSSTDLAAMHAKPVTTA